MRHHRSIYCILPPQVLDRIARNGSEEQRRRALDTLSRDHAVRAARIHNLARRAPGAIPRVNALAAPGMDNARRTIFDAKGTEQWTGNIVRSEGGDPTGDAAADEAYDGLGDTYHLYSAAFQRDSIDGRGLPLDGVVHFDQNYDNAFWDGTEMVFGDGDGELFNRFTISVDVIGHELTHGVTENETGLFYFYQSGALNESISDVFGSLVKQMKLNQTADEADWLIGEGLLAEGVQGVALRSMKDPGTAFDDPVLGKDDQPAKMDDFVYTYSDNGGVHTNSGIPNHAFYLAANNLGGYAWDKAGHIWYHALQDPRVRPTTRFRGFARATQRAAATLFHGETADEVKAVTEAWYEVGVLD